MERGRLLWVATLIAGGCGITGCAFRDTVQLIGGDEYLLYTRHTRLWEKGRGQETEVAKDLIKKSGQAPAACDAGIDVLYVAYQENGYATAKFRCSGK